MEEGLYKMKSIVYYCGPDFDPTCGTHLTAEAWLILKIRNAKDMKYEIDTTTPFDSIRSNRIQVAIEKWQEQLDEINGISQEIE